MKKVLSILIVLALVMLSGCGNGSGYTRTNELSDNEDNTYDGASYTDEYTSSNDESNTIIVETTTEETTTSNTDLKIISENPFSYQFKFIDDKYTVYYKAPIDGLYRFVLETNDVSLNYNFVIYNSINEKVINTVSSKYTEGVTASLIEDEIYEIILFQDEGFPKASITICQPNPTRTMQIGENNGGIDYIDQQNEYTFTTTRDGYYGFDLQISDVNCDYKVILRNNINERIINTRYSYNSHYQSVYLEKNQKYSLTVIYYKGLPDYNIVINEPQEWKTVDGSFSGSIDFKGQKNYYTFRPKESGDYKVSTSFGNKQGCCETILKDEKNARLFTSTNEYIKNVYFDASQEYTFIVSYDNCLMDYDVIIERNYES